MKNNALFLLVLAGLLTACQESLNPPVEQLPAAQFDYTILEQRTEHKEFHWAEVNGVLDNGEESTKMLYVTAYNDVTLNVTAPVNVCSSDPKVVSVERIGSSGSSFKLHYKADGAATITMWNGTEGKDKIQRSFSVAAVEFIDVKGIVFEWEGKELVITRHSSSRPGDIATNDADDVDKRKAYPGQRNESETDFFAKHLDKPAIWVWDNWPEDQVNGHRIPDPDQGALLVFKGITPENASFRTITCFESEFDYLLSYNAIIRVRSGYTEGPNHGPWPNDVSIDRDISCYVGTDTWVAGLQLSFYMAGLRFKCGNTSKYFYLWYSRTADEANRLSQQP